MEVFSAIVLGLLSGAVVTVIVTSAALTVATILGFALALLRQFSGSRAIGLAIDIYGELLRDVPAITHLFIIYFGLASIGLRIPSIPAAILGLGMIGSAITADIFRSGYSSLNKGQSEAALAAGFTPLQSIWFLLTPQSLRVALPPLGNYALQLIKDTSIVSAIAAPEIMFHARTMVTSSFQTTLIYSTAAVMYFLLSLPFAALAGALEARFSRGRR